VCTGCSVGQRSCKRASRHDFAAEIGHRPARHGHAGVHRPLAGDPLHFNDDVGWRSGLCARPRLLLKAGQPLGEEALATFTDDLARRIQAGRNDIVGQPFGCEQDQLGADDVSIR
jgi:hypothetical protein